MAANFFCLLSWYNVIAKTLIIVAIKRIDKIKFFEILDKI